jgi:hypothetical protein
LTHIYHPLLADTTQLEAVELEDGLPLDELDDDEQERVLDGEFLDGHLAIRELDLHSVVKCCWPEHMHGYHPAFDELAHEGLEPSSPWVGKLKPQAQALRSCWMHGEL